MIINKAKGTLSPVKQFSFVTRMRKRYVGGEKGLPKEGSRDWGTLASQLSAGVLLSPARLLTFERAEGGGGYTLVSTPHETGIAEASDGRENRLHPLSVS